MVRFAIVWLAGFLLLCGGPLQAADHPAAGTWKFTFPIPAQNGPIPLTVLVMFSDTDKGWVGDFLGSSQQLRTEPTFDKVTFKDDLIVFSMKLGTTSMSFDGRISKDGKKIPGTFNFNGQTLLVELIPSKLKNLKDPFAAAKEALEGLDGGVEYFEALYAVLAQASQQKMKPEDVRVITDRATKTAERYGLRWQRMVAQRIASILVEQEGFAAIALEQARQSERTLKADDDLPTQIQVLETLAGILRKAKKLDEVKAIDARLTKMLVRDYADYVKNNPLKIEEYKARKGKSDRVVVVELFTGVEAESCVPMELAYDALLNTYKPTEVIALQYHVPFGGFDALTIRDSMVRIQTYAANAQPAPAVYINGKKDETGGAARNSAKLKYTGYRESIDDLLEKPATVKLQLGVVRKGEEITMKCSVADLEKPGEKVVLRFVLVEERVRYVGSNGLRYHQSVVRAFPGGVKGFVLDKKTAEPTATVNLEKLREEIGKQLTDLAMELGEPVGPRPIDMAKLRVIALVQDDASGDILQATQVEVEAKKE